MKYTSIICNVSAKEWGLNLVQAYVFGWIYETPSWARPVSIAGNIYYYVDRNTIAAELALVSDKPDTIYRIIKQLVQAGVISHEKIGRKDYIMITEKGKKWGRKPENKEGESSGEKSEKNPSFENSLETNSEINPETDSKLGKKSEKNSEKNPTDNIIIYNKNIKEKEDKENFSISPEVENPNLDNNTSNEKNTPLQKSCAKKGSPHPTEDEVKAEFERFRKSYKGDKKGLDREFDNFKKKNRSNYKEIVFKLYDAYQKQLEIKEKRKQAEGWAPAEPHLSTWINQARWEMEMAEPEQSPQVYQAKQPVQTVVYTPRVRR